MKTGKTLITAMLAVSMIVVSGTATAAGPVSSSPAPTAFLVPTQPGGSGGGTGSSGTGGGINSGSTGGSTSGTGTANSSGVTANSSTINSSGTITGNYAQSYTGRGDTGCPFTPGDLGCRGELMSGGQVVCSPC